MVLYYLLWLHISYLYSIVCSSAIMRSHCDKQGYHTFIVHCQNLLVIEGKTWLISDMITKYLHQVPVMYLAAEKTCEWNINIEYSNVGYVTLLHFYHYPFFVLQLLSSLCISLTMAFVRETFSLFIMFVGCWIFSIPRVKLLFQIVKWAYCVVQKHIVDCTPGILLTLFNLVRLSVFWCVFS